jgi:hypothetical protein
LIFVCFVLGDRMAIATLLPQSAREDERIDVAFLPPLALLACSVNLAVMGSTKRHGEFIADLEAEPPGLRVANVVRVRRRAAANRARLTGDEAEVLLASDALRLTDGQDALVDLTWEGVRGRRDD